MTTTELWETIVELGIATDNEIDLVTDINGNSIETLNDIIYARTGYRDLESYEESELDGYDDDDEPDDIDSDEGFDPYLGGFTFDC